MENVEVKGQEEKKVAKKASSKKKVPMRKKKEKKEGPYQQMEPSKVEADRSEPSPFLISRIKKMTKEQKETAIAFMESRNEARVRAFMEPAYTQEDMDLYK